MRYWKALNFFAMGRPGQRGGQEEARLQAAASPFSKWYGPLNLWVDIPQSREQRPSSTPTTEPVLVSDWSDSGDDADFPGGAAAGDDSRAAEDGPGGAAASDDPRGAEDNPGRGEDWGGAEEHAARQRARRLAQGSRTHAVKIIYDCPGPWDEKCADYVWQKTGCIVEVRSVRSCACGDRTAGNPDPRGKRSRSWQGKPAPGGKRMRADSHGKDAPGGKSMRAGGHSGLSWVTWDQDEQAHWKRWWFQYDLREWMDWIADLPIHGYGDYDSREWAVWVGDMQQRWPGMLAPPPDGNGVWK